LSVARNARSLILAFHCLSSAAHRLSDAEASERPLFAFVFIQVAGCLITSAAPLRLLLSISKYLPYLTRPRDCARCLLLTGALAATGRTPRKAHGTEVIQKTL
jgi:hypothetical protein